MAIESVSNNTHNVSLSSKPAAKQINSVEQKQANPVGEVNDVNLDVQVLLAKANATPTVNQDKVATLKAAVQSGDYQPNPERIASKMMQLELS